MGAKTRAATINTLGAVAVAACSITGTVYGAKAHYLDEIRDEQKALERANGALESVKRERDGLARKYALCTQVNGKAVNRSSIDSSWITSDLRTGDLIRFPLASSSAVVRLVRVTKEGAVLRVEECDHPETVESVTSPADGQLAFLLSSEHPISFSVSSDCCLKGLGACDAADLEQIDLHLEKLDTEEQTVAVRHRKSLMQGRSE